MTEGKPNYKPSWAGEAPDFIKEYFGSADKNSEDWFDNYFDSIQENLNVASARTMKWADQTIEKIVLSIRKNTGCSRMQALQTVKDCYFWMVNIQDLEMAIHFMNNIDFDQLGMGNEENARLASSYLDSVTRRSYQINLSESERQFEATHGMSILEYMQAINQIIQADRENRE